MGVEELVAEVVAALEDPSNKIARTDDGLLVSGTGGYVFFAACLIVGALTGGVRAEAVELFGRGAEILEGTEVLERDNIDTEEAEDQK